VSTLGDRLKAARKKRGLTQENAAKLLGVGRATLANWEVGRADPSTDDIRSMARLYNVTADYLLDLEPITHSPLPARDSWKQAPDFPAALLLISEIQDAHGLSPAQAMDMVKEASEFFNFRLPDMDIRQKAAHTSGKASLGGSGIFRKRKQHKPK